MSGNWSGDERRKFKSTVSSVSMEDVVALMSQHLDSSFLNKLDPLIESNIRLSNKVEKLTELLINPTSGLYSRVDKLETILSNETGLINTTNELCSTIYGNGKKGIKTIVTNLELKFYGVSIVFVGIWFIFYEWIKTKL